MKREYIVKAGAMLFIGIMLISLICFNFPESSAMDESSKTDITEGNNAFTFDLYAKLKEKEGNLFLSPFSISSALAMTYAGARGNTAIEIAAVLHFPLSQENLHLSFSTLMQDLRSDSEKKRF